MTWSLRRRLTAAVVGLVAVAFATLAVLLYLGVHRAAWRQQDHMLESRARALATIAEREGDGYEMPLPPDPDGVPPAYVEVWQPDGSVVARSPSLHGGELPRTFAEREGFTFHNLPLPDGRDGRAVALWFTPRNDSQGSADTLLLVLAEGTEDVDAVVARVRTWFAAVGIPALAGIALVTALLLTRGLRPLGRLAAEIDQIDDRRLDKRLSTEAQPIELQAPVRKLNDLLARLDASFARERQFTADVSHELRTPVSGLRTLLEVTARADRTGPEYRAAISSALEIVLQLGTVAENLLMLARLDAGQVRLELGDVELRLLVEECWRPYAALAASREVMFRNLVDPGATARTDRDKLRIVISNLLANAAEYTQSGGWIEVKRGAGTVLEVADSGPPLSPEHAEHVFDRLWRGDHARTQTGVHCGIGLSISRALCTSLSFELSVSSSEACVSFQIATR